MFNLILTFLWALLISIYSVPSIIHVAHSKNLLDQPNHRTIHESLVPRLGGIAIFTGFISSITIFGNLENGVQQLLAGCFIIFFVGVKDDLVNVSVFKKFFLQLLATSIVVFMTDIRITSFQGLFGVYELVPNLSYPLTFIIIIGLTNAINLIDGLDGLAGSIVVTISLSLGIYFFIFGEPSFTFVAFALAGAVIGFLRYNMMKATIFMGDTGSLVCGFIISVMSIYFVEMKSITSSPAISIGILIIPIFDTLRVIILRVFKGVSPFHPDKNHIHHKLLSFGIPQLSVVLILVSLNLLIIFAVSYFSYLGNTQLILGLVLIMLIISVILESVYSQKAYES
jgi:UDP-N-acetylmuramyl pentapeptide phosphotransferase/UDP-N-acetylglucosamine-1-phosphate transferase